MIKMLAFVRRVPHLTPDEFHAYWRDVHAARIAADADARRLVRRYELNHRLAADYERERHAGEMAGPQWDGVAVQWFDSLESYQAFGALPQRAEWHALDAGRFRVDEVAMVVTHEPEVIVERPGGRERAGLKLTCILRRHPAFDLPAFHSHWLHHHGGLFQNVAELNAPLLAYDQNHGLDLPGADYDGVTEQWFESLEAWITSLGVESHRTLVEPDVASFLDPTSIQYILSAQPTVVLP